MTDRGPHLRFCSKDTMWNQRWSRRDRRYRWCAGAVCSARLEKKRQRWSRRDRRYRWCAGAVCSARLQKKTLQQSSQWVQFRQVCTKPWLTVKKDITAIKRGPISNECNFVMTSVCTKPWFIVARLRVF